MIYGAANPVHADLHYGVVVVKSNTWPGALSFFSNGRWSSVYLGDGLKYEDHCYYPVSPPCLMSDPAERPTCQEVSTF